MKRKKITERSNQESNPLIEELSGYLELGMTDEALHLAKAILSKPKLAASEFHEAMEAVLVADKIKPWRKTVESAYARLSRRDQRLVRSEMLGFYCALNDFENAGKFLSFKRKSTPIDLFFALDVLLQLEKLDEARRKFPFWKDADDFTIFP